jgi:hypothetical protein
MIDRKMKFASVRDKCDQRPAIFTTLAKKTKANAA